MKPSSAEKLAFSLRRIHRCFPNKFISIFIPIYYYRYNMIAHISEMSIPYLKKNLCADKTAGLPGTYRSGSPAVPFIHYVPR